MNSKILATGSYLPKQIRTNADLEKMVDTSDEWIVTRSGMKERRIATPDETVATMGFEAAKQCLAQPATHTLIQVRLAKSKACWALKMRFHLMSQPLAQVLCMH